jgi:hypothetical protein
VIGAAIMVGRIAAFAALAFLAPGTALAQTITHALLPTAIPTRSLPREPDLLGLLLGCVAYVDEII